MAGRKDAHHGVEPSSHVVGWVAPLVHFADWNAGSKEFWPQLKLCVQVILCGVCVLVYSVKFVRIPSPGPVYELWTLNYPDRMSPQSLAPKDQMTPLLNICKLHGLSSCYIRHQSCHWTSGYMTGCPEVQFAIWHTLFYFHVACALVTNCACVSGWSCTHEPRMRAAFTASSKVNNRS